MPMIRVQMFPGRTADQKEALVKEVSEAIVRTCDAKLEDVWVIIDEVDREHWALGGTMYSRR
ncbi:2-hydroxymuconate tautomerase [Streptomyces sp. NBC_01190]|uniref:2-hydroxymuconate tautomerase n=1 Tax=Streptomyces sp. NBC_01190 TaxID=2903767 RepID=UPI00386BACD9|nr:2-hydroxymuconate tautomerase family protein [Streptomyces sp. NBC_01190]